MLPSFLYSPQDAIKKQNTTPEKTYKQNPFSFAQDTLIYMLKQQLDEQ